MPLSPAQIAALGERVVVRAVLIDLDFTSQRERIHLGYGDVLAGSEVWRGIGECVAVQGLERAVRGQAPQARFSLSGVENKHIANFRSQRTEVRGRRVTVSLQIYDGDMRVIATPIHIYTGVMDRMTLRRSRLTSTIIVTAEQPFARRARVPAGSLSDRDQKRLYPDDRGLEQMAQMEHRATYWPIIVG